MPISSTGEPSTTVALSDLKELKDGSNLTLVFDVSFDGGLTKVQFPVLTLSVVQVISGFEDFEAAAIGTIPTPPGRLFFSGLRIHSDPYTSGMLSAIARATTQQGEHGFQYLSVRHADTTFGVPYITLPEGDFKTVTLTLWIVSGASRYCAVIYHLKWGGNTSNTIHLTSEKQLVSHTAPPGTVVDFITIHPVSLTYAGVIACDSIRWTS